MLFISLFSIFPLFAFSEIVFLLFFCVLVLPSIIISLLASAS